LDSLQILFIVKKKRKTEEYKCGKTFENKAGLANHQNWCDGTGLISNRKEKERKKEKIETEKRCEYGCGEKARWSMKNGNLSCSEYSALCEAIKEKNSKGLKTAWKENPWSTGGNTGGGWNKGKTCEEAYGEEKSKKVKSKLSKSLKEADTNS